ncbi:MAG: 50S ribosomal protein P1 [Candidatus Aenigmarchaeota archaeon]|nr:50S ribosomal protein P1 [Candidatus Aenigmarchaeota archaeon]
MEMIYAALLLHSAGKEISEENMKKVLEAVGEKHADHAKIKAVVASLEGVNIEDAIKQSQMVAAPAPAAAGAHAEPKKDEKKAEEDDKKKAEEAAAGLAGLFG